MFLFLINTISTAQSIDSIKIKPLSRTRIINGLTLWNYSGVHNKPLYYMNANFRSSTLSESAKFFSIGIASEPGINIQFAPEEGGILIVPYGKVGPEISLSNNIYLAANVGLVGVIYPKVIGFITLIYGINIFHLIKISDEIFIEFESGFHSPIQYPKAMLYYFAVGVSFN